MTEEISEVKRRHSARLRSLPNVVGLGVHPGRKTLIVYVSRKVPLADLAEDERIPPELDGVSVEVEVMAPLRRQDIGRSENDG